MELKQLQYFLVVADCLNFSRAAEQLYISQPALSYHIAELERELKTELFVRAPRQLYLTAEGQSLRIHARQLLRQAEALPCLVLQDSAGPERMLRIGFDRTEDHFEFTGITQAIANLLLENRILSLNFASFRLPNARIKSFTMNWMWPFSFYGIKRIFRPV